MSQRSSRNERKRHRLSQHLGSFLRYSRSARREIVSLGEKMRRSAALAAQAPTAHSPWPCRLPVILSAREFYQCSDVSLHLSFALISRTDKPMPTKDRCSLGTQFQISARDSVYATRSRSREPITCGQFLRLHEAGQ